ncbi:NADH dehydrogenase [ubiquinone] 1 beta subcomplex subunit 6 [Diachasma alloeum]|uniref:B17 subunit, NADH-dehydrogenase n=1 Tax=Diachasma alloeum TaxID=454923 RepID=A0A4E0S0W9_9HYME|nr:NADH dehydrogenase [ubiquinone] 1 beta subcomplex subunit 6 [Diachasma alloeum]THK32920.1 B17 subunit, NADH-dehydrogenase [Diachasma alloeum]
MSTPLGDGTAANQSDTGGVKGFTITGRMTSERERVLGMSPEERAWRAQWLKDQVLAPDEPKENPEYYRQRYNILRRFYRAPLKAFEDALRPKLGAEFAYVIRHLISSAAFSMIGVWSIMYYFKYNQSDWTKKSGWKVGMSRKKLFPNDPEWPNFETKQDHEYASYGFTKSNI